MYHHLAATSGFLPVVHMRKKENLDNVLSGKEVRSLIVSALIFLSVFAWVDALATAYRSKILQQRPHAVAGMPFFPHHIPENLNPNTLQDLDVRSKIGYAALLTAITGVTFVTMNFI